MRIAATRFTRSESICICAKSRSLPADRMSERENVSTDERNEERERQREREKKKKKRTRANNTAEIVHAHLVELCVLADDEKEATHLT